MKQLVIFLLLIYQAGVQADIEIVSPLNFGKIVVVDDSSINTVKITPEGEYFSSGNIYTFQSGSPAEIHFYNYPAYAQLFFKTIVINSELTSRRLYTGKFQVEELTLKTQKITDANGEAVLKIGGTLKTSGMGQSYTDSTYKGFFSINVIY